MTWPGLHEAVQACRAWRTSDKRDPSLQRDESALCDEHDYWTQIKWINVYNICIWKINCHLFYLFSTQNIQTFNVLDTEMYDWMLKETGVRIEFFHSPIKTRNLDIFAYLQTLEKEPRELLNTNLSTTHSQLFFYWGSKNAVLYHEASSGRGRGRVCKAGSSI